MCPDTGCHESVSSASHFLIRSTVARTRSAETFTISAEFFPLPNPAPPVSMKLRYQCPRCETPQSQDISAPEAEIRCAGCDWTHSIEPDELSDSPPSHCLICGNNDLWRQKDFPQSIGLTMVAAGATLSSIAWWYHRPVWALGILMAFAAIDLLL